MIESITEARAALERLHDVEEVHDLSKRAAAAAGYYQRAKETRQLANRATEVRIWAERRAGWLLIEEGVDYKARGDVARRLGTNGQTVWRWLSFAKALESAVEAVIAEAYAKDMDLNVNGVMRRLQTRDLERVERGIYVNYLGRYVLRWRRDGISRQQIVGNDLKEARHQLLVVTGKAKPLRSESLRRTPKDDIDNAYSGVRSALQLIDRAHAFVEPEVRADLEAAAHALYKAEDALGRALRGPGMG
jgi:hypothetical protein